MSSWTGHAAMTQHWVVNLKLRRSVRIKLDHCFGLPHSRDSLLMRKHQAQLPCCEIAQGTNMTTCVCVCCSHDASCVPPPPPQPQTMVISQIGEPPPKEKGWVSFWFPPLRHMLAVCEGPAGPCQGLHRCTCRTKTGLLTRSQPPTGLPFATCVECPKRAVVVWQLPCELSPMSPKRAKVETNKEAAT